MESSEAMLKGMYFEYLAIGGGVGDEDITDLPRLKSGKKSADQERIEEQAAIFKNALFNEKSPYYLGIKVLDTQVPLEDETTKGVLDILAEIDGKKAIVDVKLTRDFYGVNPPYSYGDIGSMDMIQLQLYKRLYDKLYNDDVDTYLLVADYSTKLNRKLVKVNISDGKLDEANTRVTVGYEVIDAYQEHGWVFDPSERECKSCPLKCEHRFEKQVIPIEVINV